ncbi:hypothetical protein ACFZAV_41675 [Streptomyces sp. NPDC008343]
MRVGRLWPLPPAQRILLVAVYRTSLAMRMASLFGVSPATV